MLSLTLAFRRRPQARRSLPSLVLAICILAPATLRAQQLPEGLVAGQSALPPTTSLVLATAAGTVLFDGTTVTLLPPGQPQRILLQLPGVVFGSFLLQSDAAHVLFGHAGPQHAIWHLPLQGPPPAQPLALLGYNYDACMLDGARALVSARTGGFSAADNELWVLDLATGNTSLLASIPGASGPVAIAGNGDVYYATGFAGFPVPPATTRILRFPRTRVDAALAANRVLGLAHATVVITGLDAASDMVFDDDDDLLFVDWFNSRVGEISDATGSQPAVAAAVVDYGTSTVLPTTVQFVRGNQAGIFEPFQQPNGTLLVHETDYVSVNRTREIQARPAMLATTQPSPIPAGAFDFVATNGPAGGLGLLAFAFGNAPGTIVVHVPGFEAPLPWSNSLTGSPILVPIAFDPAGHSAETVQNPGFAPAVAAMAQVVFVSLTGALGATAPLSVLIGQ